MHVLSARRRLSGMSRRDAALAFVAWEGGDPGNDYRKQPDDLAELSAPSLPDRKIGNGHEHTSFGELGPQRAQGGRGMAEGSRPWRTAVQELVAGQGDEALVCGRPNGPRDWRHELSNLQWIGLVLAITALTAVLLAATAIGIHEFMLAVQRITHR